MGINWAEHSLEVEAPIETCFDAIVDYESFPRWQSAVISIEVVSRDRDGLGERVTLFLSAKGQKVDYTLDYSYERPTGISWDFVEGHGVDDVDGTYTFEDLGGGRTRINYRLGIDPSLPIPGIVARRIHSQALKKSVEELKDEAERRRAEEPERETPPEPEPQQAAEAANRKAEVEPNPEAEVEPDAEAAVEPDAEAAVEPEPEPEPVAQPQPSPPPREPEPASRPAASAPASESSATDAWRDPLDQVVSLGAQAAKAGIGVARGAAELGVGIARGAAETAVDIGKEAAGAITGRLSRLLGRD